MARDPEPITGVILAEDTIYTFGELGRASGLTGEELLRMVSVGVLEPMDESGPSWRFTGRSVSRLQRALRLQRDLGINPEGAALALDLLEELAELRCRSERLERQIFD